MMIDKRRNILNSSNITVLLFSVWFNVSNETNHILINIFLLTFKRRNSDEIIIGI